MQIELDKDTIQKAVTQAILDSTIGATVKDAIQERLKDWKFRDAMTKVVDAEISRVVGNMLREEGNQNILREKVKAALTDDVLAQIVGQAMQKFWDR